MAGDDQDRALDDLQRAQLERELRQQRATVQLEPHDLAAIGAPSWPLVSAALERAAPGWGHRAIRLGILALLAECANSMAIPNANKALVAHAQELIDALNRVAWEQG